MPPGLRDYISHLRDTRTELCILLASALLVLVLAEPLSMWILQKAAPGWHASMQNWLTPTLRRWVIGLPLALCVLGLVLWNDWRRIRSGR